MLNFENTYSIKNAKKLNRREIGKLIKHIVLYKFKDTISQDIIKHIVEKFESCKNQLEGITEIEFGENCSLKKHLDHGFNYGLFMTFEDVEVIKKYNELEEHKKVQEMMSQYQKDLLVFDIEC